MNKASFEHYKIHIKEIDDQHWELIEIFTSIQNKAETDATIDFSAELNILIDKIMTHFRTEEALMEKHKYPYITYHRKAHTDMLVEVDRLSKMPTTPRNRSNLLNKLYDTLITHVDIDDMQLIEFIPADKV